MIPTQQLSSSPVIGEFEAPRDFPAYTALENYELGGLGIGDTSAGLRTNTWRGRVIGDDVILDTEGVPETVVFSAPGITEFSFTFDQNMRPFIAFTADETSKFYWFDPTVSQFVVTELPAGSRNPRCTLDDKRALQNSISDIILAYLRDSSLYFRAQRDRYLIEYVLYAPSGANPPLEVLEQVGMADNLRLRFRCRVPIGSVE